jgi:hypothetical protein
MQRLSRHQKPKRGELVIDFEGNEYVIFSVGMKYAVVHRPGEPNQLTVMRLATLFKPEFKMVMQSQ